MSHLTEKDKAKIARNREIALQRRAERLKREREENLTKSAPSIFIPPSTSNVPRPSTDYSGPSTSTWTHSSPHSNHTTINIEFVTHDRLKIEVKPFNSRIVSIIRKVRGSLFNAEKKYWTIPMSEGFRFEKAFKEVEDLHIDTEMRMPPKSALYQLSTFKCESVPENLNELLPDSLLEQLFPYQVDAVRFVLERGGRAIIADEMGLGKSVEALAAARVYHNEWPLLIVCPSSVKATWRNQIKKFLPQVCTIKMIDKGSDELPKDKDSNLVIIMSYDMLAMKDRDVAEAKLKVVIFDESHKLKETKTWRTIAAQNVADIRCSMSTIIQKVATRLLLLSGTPALSRPSELFSQIKLVCPQLFPSFIKFAERYCEGHRGEFGFEAKGSSMSEELKIILLRRVMIRREKSQVMHELLDKNREVTYLSGKWIDYRQEAFQKAKLEFELHKKYQTEYKESTATGAGVHHTLLQYYSETAIIKASAVCKHIVEKYFANKDDTRKIIFFAQHRVMMDAVQDEIRKQGVRWIRIDGSTPQKDRGPLCDEFQNDPLVKVAILSINAAGVGITLTAAATIVFCELYWNPGMLIQAEDRAHRVGQEQVVNVEYLLASNTADDPIWKLVQEKLNTLEQISLSSDTFRDAKETHKQMGTQFIEVAGQIANKSEEIKKETNAESDDDFDDYVVINRRSQLDNDKSVNEPKAKKLRIGTSENS